MTVTLRRRIPVSGMSTARIPVRVESTVTGVVAGLTTADRDGLYQLDVPGGKYRVTEKFGRSFEVVVPEAGGPFDVGSLAGEASTTGPLASKAPRQESNTPEPSQSEGVESSSASHRPARVPRDGSSGRTHTEPQRRIPRNGAVERERGVATRPDRGIRAPRDGGRRGDRGR